MPLATAAPNRSPRSLRRPDMDNTQYIALSRQMVMRRQLENPLATQLLEERFSGATGVRVRSGDSAESPFVFEPA